MKPTKTSKTNAKSRIIFFTIVLTYNLILGFCLRDFIVLSPTLHKRDNNPNHHTWNRVYLNGSWWNMDVTFDIVQTKNQGELYGFRKIEDLYIFEELYLIKRIY